MSSLTEKDIKAQELLERGLKSENQPDSKDLTVYQTVFEALEKKPASGLPFDFASKVVAEIRNRQNLAFAFRRQIMVLVFLGITILSFYFGISVVNRELALTLIRFALLHKWFACFGLCIYLLVEYINYKVVRK